MSSLSEQAIYEYLAPLAEDQVNSIRLVRGLILSRMSNLVEAVDTGKWFGGLLTYTSVEGEFAFALGPRKGGMTTFHMMPYYALAALQERNGAALKELLSGKSCIQFRHFTDLPLASIEDILDATPKYLEVAREMWSKQKKR